MASDELEHLVEAFARFPGIGPRQAQRMVYYLLRQNKTWVDDLAHALRTVKAQMASCVQCRRHFIPKAGERLCSLCASDDRDAGTLMIVEKDLDLDNIERSGTFQGRYFVLGGTISALEKEPDRKIRLTDLVARVARDASAGVLKEVILALSATPDGDDTADLIHERLERTLRENRVRLTHLGRGLSTGSELEYADKETIRAALKRRTDE